VETLTQALETLRLENELLFKRVQHLSEENCALEERAAAASSVQTPQEPSFNHIEVERGAMRAEMDELKAVAEEQKALLEVTAASRSEAQQTAARIEAVEVAMREQSAEVEQMLRENQRLVAEKAAIMRQQYSPAIAQLHRSLDDFEEEKRHLRQQLDELRAAPRCSFQHDNYGLGDRHLHEDCFQSPASGESINLRSRESLCGTRLAAIQETADNGQPQEDETGYTHFDSYDDQSEEDTAAQVKLIEDLFAEDRLSSPPRLARRELREVCVSTASSSSCAWDNAVIAAPKPEQSEVLSGPQRPCLYGSVTQRCVKGGPNSWMPSSPSREEQPHQESPSGCTRNSPLPTSMIEARHPWPATTVAGEAHFVTRPLAADRVTRALPQGTAAQCFTKEQDGEAKLLDRLDAGSVQDLRSAEPRERVPRLSSAPTRLA